VPFRFPSRRLILTGVLRFCVLPLGLLRLGVLPLGVLPLGVLPLLLCAQHAEAHAILEESEPANGARIAAGRIVLRLRYNSRIDRERSRLTLTRPDQTRSTLTIDPDGPPDILTAAVTLTPGAYVVRWQVLAIDGHITRGDVAFTVTDH
jgi:copper resistance protein C